jgi:hypothetical protein
MAWGTKRDHRETRAWKSPQQRMFGMPAIMTFFPLGNADTTLLRLANDDLVLMDFANMRNPADPNDRRSISKVMLIRPSKQGN